MQNFLIGYYDSVLIYGKETPDCDIEIKFIEIPPLAEITPLHILQFRDFRAGYIRLADFERRRYGDYIYCRIYGCLFRIDIPNRSYEVVETDFSGICFMQNYILIMKDSPTEQLFKLTPPGVEISKKVKLV